MVDRWLLGWDRVEGESAGSWAAGPVRPKLVLHTTEGHGLAGALGAYRTNRSWPHATVDPVRRTRTQHLPLDVPARALRNTSGGVQTGRAPTVIQVEILGFAGQTHTWSDDELAWLGREVVGPLCRGADVPVATAVTFHGERAGWVLASTSARQRLSGPAWLAYSGVLGHQHVPENTHWDPGALPIDRVLAAARGTDPTTNPGGFLMALTDREQKRLLDQSDRTIASLTRVEANQVRHGGQLAVLEGRSLDDYKAQLIDIAEARTAAAAQGKTADRFSDELAKLADAG